MRLPAAEPGSGVTELAESLQAPAEKLTKLRPSGSLWFPGPTRSWLTDLVSMRQRPRRAAGVSYGQPFFRASVLHSKTGIVNSKHGDACLVGAVCKRPGFSVSVGIAGLKQVLAIV